MEENDNQTATVPATAAQVTTRAVTYRDVLEGRNTMSELYSMINTADREVQKEALDSFSEAYETLAKRTRVTTATTTAPHRSLEETLKSILDDGRSLYSQASKKKSCCKPLDLTHDKSFEWAHSLVDYKSGDPSSYILSIGDENGEYEEPALMEELSKTFGAFKIKKVHKGDGYTLCSIEAEKNTYYTTGKMEYPSGSAVTTSRYITGVMPMVDKYEKTASGKMRRISIGAEGKVRDLDEADTLLQGKRGYRYTISG